MKLAFRMYDVDNDNQISQKDLFNPLLHFTPKLYSEVYVLDLPKMLYTQPLNFQQFTSCFNDYPAIIIDIIHYISGLKLNKKLPEKPILKKHCKEEQEESLEDKKIKKDIEIMLGSEEMSNKIIKIYKMLVENSSKSLSEMHITLYSLTNGFVYFKWTVGRSIWIYE